MATPSKAVPLEKRVSKAEFNLAFVLDALVRAGLLAEEQRREVASREGSETAKLLRARGAIPGASHEVSPIELVASFGIPMAGRPGVVLDEDVISQVVAPLTGVPYRKIDPLKLDMGLITRTLSKAFALRHVVLPLERAEGKLVIAVANPFDAELFESLKGFVGGPVAPALSAKADIERALEHVYGFRTSVTAAVDQATGDAGISNFEQLVHLSSDRELDGNDRPVVTAVEYLLRYAFDQRASDIHVEPKREMSLVRLRIDGVLHPVYQLPKSVHAPITARLKTLSRMDISEKRRPQDGRIKTERDGREVELRVSTIPTAFGEKVVLRIFDPDTLVQDLAQIGFDPHEQAMFEEWIARPHGLILVTGPTGSGKTTTLYSALKLLAGPDVNVTTIEDPIEMVWEGFNQIQVQPKIDLDFAASLRHILRQDPDIIMVGEIRDKETADNAIQAALTGHLVLSTLHTNTAAEAVTRLTDLGVQPFLLASSAVGIMAQRLVRNICAHCSQEATLSSDQVAALRVPLPLAAGGMQIRQGAGCARCRNTGYRGRRGVFEMISVTPEIAKLISAGAPSPDIEQAARKSGLRSLRESAVRKLAAGLTTFEEVVRVT